MKPWQLWLPLFAIVGLAITMPGWAHFLGQLTSLNEVPAHVKFLSALVLPVFVLLLGASWLEPR